MSDYQNDYKNRFIDAFLENPLGVIAHMSTMSTQQALIEWDRARARQYVLSNPDIIQNQSAIEDIMNRNQLNRNYEGLKLAHEIFAGEARDEEAHWRQEHAEQGEPESQGELDIGELERRFNEKVKSFNSQEEVDKWYDGLPQGVESINFNDETDPELAERLSNYLDNQPFDGPTEKDAHQEADEEQ